MKKITSKFSLLQLLVCRKDLVALLLIQLSYVVIIGLTWNRWTHLLIDHGREFNVPLRLINGEKLYTDIHYFYGPLAPYLNVVLFKIFGAKLATLHAAGYLCGVIILMMVYWLSRNLMGVTESLIVGLFTIFTCSASTFLGNHIQPYSYAALYGYLFSIFSLCCAIKFLQTRSLKSICFGGIAVGLATLSKPELALLSSLPIISAWIFVCLPEFKELFQKKDQTLDKLTRIKNLLLNKNPDSYFYYSFWSFICYLIIVVTGYIWFVFTVPYYMLVTNNYEIMSTPPLVYFYKLISGTDSIALTFKDLTNRDISLYFQNLSIIKWIPYLIVSLLLFLIYRFIKHGNLSTNDKILFILTLFSLSAITRAFFRISIHHPYIPYMVATSMIIGGYVLFKIPKVKWLMMTITFSMLISSTVHNVKLLRLNKNYPFHNEHGNLVGESYLVIPMKQAIEYTQAHTSKDDYVPMLPQGTMFNFLSDRRNPLFEEMIVPGFAEGKREDLVINRLKETAPPIIFVNNIKTHEFNAPIFGIDYNQKLMKWIVENYKRKAVFSEYKKDKFDYNDWPFFIEVYEKIR